MIIYIYVTILYILLNLVSFRGASLLSFFVRGRLAVIARTSIGVFHVFLYTIVLRTQPNTLGKGAPVVIRPPWRPAVPVLRHKKDMHHVLYCIIICIMMFYVFVCKRHKRFLHARQVGYRSLTE